jgi:CO/xanthine dehydrogenase Mo-binding subunit
LQTLGGKTIVYLELVALVLSRKSGRPVKMVMNRQEAVKACTSGNRARDQGYNFRWHGDRADFREDP